MSRWHRSSRLPDEASLCKAIGHYECLAKRYSKRADNTGRSLWIMHRLQAAYRRQLLAALRDGCSWAWADYAGSADAQVATSRVAHLNQDISEGQALLALMGQLGEDRLTRWRALLHEQLEHKRWLIDKATQHPA